MQHAFRGSRRLFAFLSACALIFAAFAAGASAHAVAKNKGHHRHGHHHGNGGGSITSNHGSTDPPGVNLYTLTNSKGMTVNITNYGGVVQSIWVPDRRGGTRTLRSASRAFRTTSATSRRATSTSRGRLPGVG